MGRKNKDSEFDLHVWAKPEDANMTALFTVSIGKRALCIDMPIDAALDQIRKELEESVNS